MPRYFKPAVEQFVLVVSMIVMVIAIVWLSSEYGAMRHELMTYKEIAVECIQFNHKWESKGWVRK